jgi:thioredoxin 1
VAGNIEVFTDKNWRKDVLESSVPVLVDFWAEWCRPCRMVTPILEEIAAEYPDKITVAKLNVDENQQTAVQFNVMSIPTLIVFRRGRPTHTRIVGAHPKPALIAQLGEYLA